MTTLIAIIGVVASIAKIIMSFFDAFKKTPEQKNLEVKVEVKQASDKADSTKGDMSDYDKLFE